MSDDYGFSTDVIEVPPAYTPKQPFADCQNCPLLHAPCVPSYVPTGSPQLIIVGEAPGYHEVQALQPFVGPSGKLLDAVLDHIEIPTEQIYKTNAVLCRPPNNDITRAQGAIKACSERLRHELASVECNTIVAMGNSAVTTLDMLAKREDKTGILKRHGNWYRIHGKGTRFDGSEYTTVEKRYLATLHPAFVLRSAGYMASLLQDMRSISVDRSKDWLETKYALAATDRDVRALFTWFELCLRTHARIAFDVETANLNPKSALLALGMATSTNEAIIITGDLIRSNSDLREILTKFLDRANLVAHNGKFDQQVLAHNGLGFFNLSNDTMLTHFALDENKGTHGLKNLLTAFLGVPDYEAQFVDKYFKNTKRGDRDYSKIPTEDLYKYLAIDCVGTLALDALFEPMIEADDVGTFRQIAIDASNALQHTEFNGIKVDVPYLQQMLVKLSDALLEKEVDVMVSAQEALRTYLNKWNSDNPHYAGLVPRYFDIIPSWCKTQEQYHAVLAKIEKGVNLNSWQQMQVLLYDVLGLKHIKKLGFKTDPRSTNAEALDALEPHPFVTTLSEYRRLAKIKGTYVEKLLDMADENGRVHINYNIHGTETGRMSANDGLHGIPRPRDGEPWGAAVRGAFMASPGYKLIACDYAQAELRIFAAESGEPFLLDMFRNGEDPHGNITLLVFGNDPRFAGMTKASWNKTTEKWTLPQLDGYSTEDQKNYWKEKRTTGKNVVFGGLVYMGGAPGIVAMIRAQTGKQIETAVVQHVLSTTLAQMPIAVEWQRNQFRKARDQGFVQNRFGFKRRFLLITDENLDEVKKASVNAPIQGAASTLTVLSGIALTKRGIKVLMYNHDQIICEVREELAEQTAQLVQRTMIEMGTKYFPEVTWRADCDISVYLYQDMQSFNDK